MKINTNARSVFSAIFALVTILSVSACAKEWPVANEKEYNEAVKQVSAGDTIVLKNGTYSDFQMVFTGEGQEDKPITLKAEKKGGVIISGQSNLRLAGEYLVVEGLVFKNGYTPTSEVISFKKDSKHLANHSRVTEVVIDDFSNPDKRENDYWIGLYGKNNRLDHNYLVGKRNRGVTVAVRLTTEESRENHHRIDHNYFGPRPIFGSNGGETLRIGTSHFSLSNSFTLVENNYFDRCNGEVEIISVKSGKNKIINNVFFESRGTLTLRHGNGNVVEGNVFFGNGVDHTGGIRVINADQVVRNNYMEGLTGYRFGSGFTVMNGVPNSPINRYSPVVNATIENNTMVDVDHIYLAAGADVERSAPPSDSVFKNNLLVSSNGKSKFSVFDDISGITFSDNVLDDVIGPKGVEQGFTEQKIDMVRAKTGLLVPKNEQITAGASRDLTPIDKAKTGPSWYPKAELSAAFDSGKVIKVKPSDDAILDAVAAATDGDVIELAAGNYKAEQIIYVDKPLTVRAEKKGSVTVKFARSALFEIRNGGSLKLENLVIDGGEAPDADGNSAIRTQKWGMYVNYDFIANNLDVVNLDVNRAYSFFDAGAGSFAKRVSISNSSFSKVTGDILRLNKEIADLGVYNAEYVTIKNSSFEDVQGVLMDVYRGGTDESTFGPHVLLENSQLVNVGHGKKNKHKASIVLHGVQVTTLKGNTFKDSAGITINHTVGDPITKVVENTFVNTPMPVVSELVFDYAPTAIIEKNQQK